MLTEGYDHRLRIWVQVRGLDTRCQPPCTPEPAAKRFSSLPLWVTCSPGAGAHSLAVCAAAVGTVCAEVWAAWWHCVRAWRVLGCLRGLLVHSEPERPMQRNRYMTDMNAQRPLCRKAAKASAVAGCAVFCPARPRRLKTVLRSSR